MRASWLFGPGGPNFVATIRRFLLEGRTPLRVVDDQHGRPTYTPYIARALWDLARAGARGIVHYGNREPASWYDLAREIARIVDPKAAVDPGLDHRIPPPGPAPGLFGAGRLPLRIARGPDSRKLDLRARFLPRRLFDRSLGASTP